MPLTIPTKYAEGHKNGENFSAVILVAGGTTVANAELEFYTGHIRNLITDWSGIQESVNPFRDSYGKHTVSFKLSNVVYKQDSSGKNVRVANELRNAIGSEAKIYFVNNRQATSLNGCLMRFKGEVASLKVRNNEVAITLNSRAVIGDSVLLTEKVKDVVDLLCSNLSTSTIKPPSVVVDTANEYVPLCYGLYLSPETTGLTKAWRLPLTSDPDDSGERIHPHYVFALHWGAPADYPEGEGTELYVPVASDGPPSVARHTETFSTVRRSSSEPGFRYIRWKSAAYSDRGLRYWCDGTFHLRPLPENTPYRYWHGEHPGLVADEDPTTTCAIKNADKDPGDEYSVIPKQAHVIWDITDPEHFKALLSASRGDDDASLLYIIWDNWDFILFETPTGDTHVTEAVWYLIHGPKVDDTTLLPKNDDKQESYSDIVLPGVDIPYLFNFILSGSVTRMEAYISDLLEQADTSTELPYKIGVRLRFFSHDPGLPTPAWGSTFATLGSAYVKVSSDMHVDKKELPEAWVRCLGVRYNDWVSNFSSVYDQYNLNGIAPTEGRLIQEASGILASIIIDLLGKDTSFIHEDSFWGNLNFIQKFRLNVTDGDTTLDKVAKQLSEQSAWTFCITAAGQAKLVNVRSTQGSPYGEIKQIRYDELAEDLEFALTEDKNLINHLTVKSRWSASRGKYLDERVFQNSWSQGRYGVRRGTVSWENICGPYNTIQQLGNL